MHILAALTDGPSARLPASQTKGAKPDGDFETAFLSMGDNEGSNGNDLIPNAPDLDPEAKPDASVEAELLETAQKDDALEIEPDELEIHFSETEIEAVAKVETEATTAVPPDSHARQADIAPDHVNAAISAPDKEGMCLTLGSETLPSEPTTSIQQGLQHKNDVSAVVFELPKTAQHVSQPQPQPQIHTPAALQSAHFPAHPLPSKQGGTKTADAMPIGKSDELLIGKVSPKDSKQEAAINPVTPMNTVPVNSKPDAILPMPAKMPTAGNPSPAKGIEHVLPVEGTPASELQRRSTTVPLQNAAAPFVQAVQQHVQKPDGPLNATGLGDVNPATLEGETHTVVGLTRSDVAQAQPLGQPTSVQHPAMPHHVARQMAEALQQGGAGPVDVALNPEELGRVRMRITLQDGGIVINILAERAETLDLMRRNADLLGQEFKDLGFGAVSFGFSTSGQDDHTEDKDGSHPQQDLKTERGSSLTAPDASVPAAQSHVTQGVDIRL